MFALLLALALTGQQKVCTANGCYIVPYAAPQPQVQVFRPPARQWLLGTEGRWYYGWWNADGSIGYYNAEQPAPPKVIEVKPKPKVEAPAPKEPAGQGPVNFAPQAEGRKGPLNFGIVIEKTFNRPQAEYFSAGQTAASHAFIQAVKDAKSGGSFPDDSGKPHLTIIGSDADRAAVMRDLKGSGPLGSMREDFLVQEYLPDEWPVTTVGMPSDGKPTIVLQQSDGKVLYRQNSYAGGEAPLADALRKHNPDYSPDKDPGPHGGGPCPLGFTRDHWPLILAVAGLVALVVFLNRKDASQ